MRYIGLLLTVLLFFCGTASAERTVWYVHPDSTLNTIQAGLDSCADNDIVLVGPGTYYENIIWPNTQGIHLVSEAGAENTIISGDTTGLGVICVESNVDSTTLIRGFTIQNGQYGLFVPSGSITIRNNIITSNNWGGIHNCQAVLILQDNSIVNNGAGLGTHGGWFELIDNDISYNVGSGLVFMPAPSDFMYSRQGIIGNTFSYNGGFGIDLYGGILKNATITHNGSGGVLVGTGADIDSCTIAHNYGPGVTSFEGPRYGRYDRQGTHINYCDISDNAGYGVLNQDTIMLIAEYNWWGDASGPYHATANPGGLGDTVSDCVDFDPWLTGPGVAEQPIVEPVVEKANITATIFRGPLQLPEGKKCRLFDITGRVVEPERIRPGIYFIEVDGVVTQKVVKIR